MFIKKSTMFSLPSTPLCIVLLDNKNRKFLNKKIPELPGMTTTYKYLNYSRICAKLKGLVAAKSNNISK